MNPNERGEIEQSRFPSHIETTQIPGVNSTLLTVTESVTKDDLMQLNNRLLYILNNSEEGHYVIGVTNPSIQLKGVQVGDVLNIHALTEYLRHPNLRGIYLMGANAVTKFIAKVGVQIITSNKVSVVEATPDNIYSSLVKEFPNSNYPDIMRDFLRQQGIHVRDEG